ncbi:MAG: 2-oxoacid:acceptor oxidoreductase subunit alpha [Methanomassiliicoccales archaeon]|nr:2-oxoacid:acceptor oxidoreductase subunit alpha [Methanomassiliicoccales archaeon]
MRLKAGTYFMQGNEACVEGAIAAGIRFFAGYPITPSTEIAEGLAERLPEEGGIFIQMEDEIASIAAVIGSSWVGAKAMTATSGPGFSLMQENIGYAAMTETPLVIIDVMRGGPSTGLPTLPSQGDVMQAKFGSHGDYQVVALAPATVQDMFDLTINAFNLSETYRVPAIVLSDAEVGHMRGKFTVPRNIEVMERRMRTDKVWHDGFAYDESLVPRFPVFGKGFRVHVTGISHDIAGYPRNEPEVHEELVRRLTEKVLRHREKICITETYNGGADRFIVTYGSPALSAMEVMANDPSIGLLQLKTLWPVPEDAIRSIAKDAREIVVLEMNLGQIFREVERLACMEGCKKVRLLSKVGGEVHTPEEIVHFLRRG